MSSTPDSPSSLASLVHTLLRRPGSSRGARDASRSRSRSNSSAATTDSSRSPSPQPRASCESFGFLDDDPFAAPSGTYPAESFHSSYALPTPPDASIPFPQRPSPPSTIRAHPHRLRTSSLNRPAFRSRPSLPPLSMLENQPIAVMAPKTSRAHRFPSEPWDRSASDLIAAMTGGKRLSRFQTSPKSHSHSKPAVTVAPEVPVTSPPSPIPEVSELEDAYEGYAELELAVRDACEDVDAEVLPTTPENPIMDPMDATPRATRISVELLVPEEDAPVSRLDIASHIAQDGHDDEERSEEDHPYALPSPPNLDIEIEVEVEIVEESFYIPTSYGFTDSYSTPPELSPQTSTTTSSSSCSSSDTEESATQTTYHPFWRLNSGYEALASPRVAEETEPEMSPAYIRTRQPQAQPSPTLTSPSTPHTPPRSKSFSAGQRRKGSHSEEEFLAHGIMMASRSRSDAGRSNGAQRGYSSSRREAARFNATDYGGRTQMQPRYAGAAPEKYQLDREEEDLAKTLRMPSSSRTARAGFPASFASRGEGEGEGSSDSDDVPLARRIPSALNAQQSIRKQARDERGRKPQDALEVDLLANKLRQVLQTNAPAMRSTVSQQTPPTIAPPPRRRLLSLGSSSKRPPPIDSQAHLHLMPVLSPTFARGGLSPTVPSNPASRPSSSRSRAMTISQTSDTVVPDAVLRRARTTREGAAALGLIDEPLLSPVPRSPVPRSQPHSRVASGNFAPPPVHVVHEVTQHRVFVNDMQQYINVDVSSSTTAEDVVIGAAGNGEIRGRDWMLWELSNEFGMERPIREYERILDVLTSWNQDARVNCFMLKQTPYAVTLAKRNVPERSPTFGGWVNWEAKRGKWSKRWLELREHSLYLSKKDNGRDGVFLCTLSTFDAYMVKRISRAPKPYVFAVKSTDNITMFENPSDCAHIFSCEDAEGKAWVEKILLARSYVLSRERSVLFRSVAPPVRRAPNKPLVAVPDASVFAEGSLLARNA